MKILFLDIDGVLNSRETLKCGTRSGSIMGIDPYMRILLDRIVQATDAKVVISSSWRLVPKWLQEIRDVGIEFISRTPYLESKKRGEEIQQWLDEHPEVENYAILDDDSDMLPGQHFFKTSFEVGLTQEIADEVINHLGRV